VSGSECPLKCNSLRRNSKVLILAIKSCEVVNSYKCTFAVSAGILRVVTLLSLVISQLVNRGTS